jgi:hypothetical protein
MQQAFQVETQVDQALVDAIPGLKPLLGHRVQVIALDLEASKTPGGVGRPDDADAKAQPPANLTLEAFLATRPAWPKDRPPLTLEEMEEGIARGALNSAGL